MKKFIFPLFFVLTALFLMSCNYSKVIKIEGGALGTYYKVAYIGEENAAIQYGVDSLLDQINAQFSIFQPTTLVSRLNQGEDLELTEQFQWLFNKSIEVSERTHGAFDITIAPLVEAWGFGKDRVMHLDSMVIDSLKQLVGYQRVHIEGNHLIKENSAIKLNFNAIAKGYAVDQIANYLSGMGYPDCLVDVGGEIVARGSNRGKPWRVGVQVPTHQADDPVETDYVFTIRDKAIATSGNYRNYIEQDGKRFTHIISPFTGGAEVSSLLSVSVIAPDCTTADAYATAFMVLGIEKSMEIIKYDTTLAAYFIYDQAGEYKTVKSDRFPDPIQR
ncbi:MAG TPA: FAD:protein FMN transferase [Bacteroidales bacterium]|nr:FAD:protein FMN transferase [Bacteroidales bacterium]